MVTPKEEHSWKLRQLKVKVKDESLYKIYRDWNYKLPAADVPLNTPFPCKMITLTEPTGVLSSPNYPNDYPNNMVECTWTIRLPEGDRIQVDFDVVEVGIKKYKR